MKDNAGALGKYQFMPSTLRGLLKPAGLSENDMDELYAEDAAEITSVIYGFMQKYLVLAKKMMGDVSVL